MAPRTPATPEPVPATPAPEPAPSVLEKLRRNRMGGLLAGLVVGIALALLLSILVPDSQVLLALTVLATAEAIAVGVVVRYVSADRGLLTQLAAFVAAAVGVHVLATTGYINTTLADLGDLGGMMPMGGKGGGIDLGLGWDDALLAALATPTASTGALLAGLVAAIIAGWGVRESR